MRSSVLTAAVVGTLAALSLTGCSSAAEDVASAPEGSTAADVSSAPEGWTVLVDEPSGVELAMPVDVDPIENQVPSADGASVTVRTYSAVNEGGDQEVAFNVIDIGGGEYDLDLGAEGSAESIGGTLGNVEDITVDGHAGVQAEISFGDGQLALFQIVELDEHVIQPMVAGAEADRQELQDTFDDLVSSVDVG